VEGNNAESSDWVRADVAAASLGVSGRTVRNFIYSGELESKLEEDGIRKGWLVSVDGLYALRDKRRLEDTSGARQQQDGQNTAELLREAAARLKKRAAEVAELRSRLELAEKANSSLRKQLEYERRRAKDPVFRAYGRKRIETT
jgi:hypothetical protein